MTDPRIVDVDQAWQRLETASRERLDGLSPSERAQLVETLTRIAEVADAMRAELDAHETADRPRRRGLRAVSPH